MRRLGLIVSVFLVAIFILLFLNRPKNLNWYESYGNESSEPYGCSIIFNLLKSLFQNYPFLTIEEKIEKSLIHDPDNHSNYVFIGEYLSLDTRDVAQLLGFVRSGNTALIISKELPLLLLDSIQYSLCDTFDFEQDLGIVSDSTILMRLSHADFSNEQTYCKYKWKHQTQTYNWDYIKPSFFCDSLNSFFPIGYFEFMNGEKYFNFAKIDFGDGKIFWHTTPLAFSNLQLLEKEHLSYASNCFSHLEKGLIYWDEFSKNRFTDNQEFSNNIPRNRSFGESPLKYILSQPALTWAWYLLLSLGLIYLVFGSKRRMAVIPIKDPKRNTSLEFIELMGRLYFLQNNHRQLALQKIKLFKSYVRSHYRIHIENFYDPELGETLSKISEVPMEVMSKIIILSQKIESSNVVTEITLAEFHRTLEIFYKNCK